MTNLLDNINDILFHTEGDHHFDLDTINKYPISTIVYGKISFLLNQLEELDPNGFFIVPAYETNNRKEIQLAVTGKCKNNENPIDAIRREVAEEVGLNVNYNDFQIINIPDKKNNLYFSLLKRKNISSNKLSTNYQETITDNPNKKIICWIYVEKINEKIIFERLRRNSNDIAGKVISIIPVSIMKMILEKWINNKIKRNSRFTFTI